MLGGCLGAQIGLGLIALGLAGTAKLALGEDPFGAAFDPAQPVQVQGQVLELQWTNPRAWLRLIGTDSAAGTPAEYQIQLLPPATLERRGWTAETLAQGDRVTVAGDRQRDGSPRLIARRILTADGTILLHLETQPLNYVVDFSAVAPVMRTAPPSGP